MIKRQLAAAFTTETAHRAESDTVMVMDERLNATAVNPSDVVSCLQSEGLAGEAWPAAEMARMVVAWDSLRHAFRPRSVLDQMCSRLMPGGRLIYGQRLVDQYLGLTAKWLLDYCVIAQYADCRIYLLWDTEDAPAVATVDYPWLLAHAQPVYNHMWDNITHADGVALVAEKGAEAQQTGLPSQDIYRPPEEWKRYADTLERLAASPRPWHLNGPAPAHLPVGFRNVIKTEPEQPQQLAEAQL
ncbi:MAG TPA: hypothetical protein VH558_01535 [Pseudolabrys sp.]|jgi:hypothetical protein